MNNEDSKSSLLLDSNRNNNNNNNNKSKKRYAPPPFKSPHEELFGKPIPSNSKVFDEEDEIEDDDLLDKIVAESHEDIQIKMIKQLKKKNDESIDDEEFLLP